MFRYTVQQLRVLESRKIEALQAKVAELEVQCLSLSEDKHMLDIDHKNSYKGSTEPVLSNDPKNPKK